MTCAQPASTSVRRSYQRVQNNIRDKHMLTVFFISRGKMTPVAWLEIHLHLQRPDDCRRERKFPLRKCPSSMLPRVPLYRRNVTALRSPERLLFAFPIRSMRRKTRFHSCKIGESAYTTTPPPPPPRAMLQRQRYPQVSCTA
jgi:hypothetical protein